MLNTNQIHAAMRERLEYLRACKEEYECLDAALKALGPVTAAPARRPRRPRDQDAPYGRKADGTPRKRPGRPKVEPEKPKVEPVTSLVA